MAALGKILYIMKCIPLTKGLDECVCTIGVHWDQYSIHSRKLIIKDWMTSHDKSIKTFALQLSAIVTWSIHFFSWMGCKNTMQVRSTFIDTLQTQSVSRFSLLLIWDTLFSASGNIWDESGRGNLVLSTELIM